MQGNLHVRFLGEGVTVRSPPYPPAYVGSIPITRSIPPSFLVLLFGRRSWSFMLSWRLAICALQVDVRVADEHSYPYRFIMKIHARRIRVRRATISRVLSMVVFDLGQFVRAEYFLVSSPLWIFNPSILLGYVGLNATFGFTCLACTATICRAVDLQQSVRPACRNSWCWTHGFF